MSLSLRILKARKEKRLSQQALASLINVSRSALAQWESDLSSPSIVNLRKMSDILEVSFEWLATGRGNRYLLSNDNDICDTDIDQEMIRLWRKISLKKKRAMLNVLKALED